jgi:hypothetical protein
LACEALDALVYSRLFDIEKAQMVEKVIITRIWITICQMEYRESLESMQEVIEALSKHLSGPLGPSASHAAQTVCLSGLEFRSKLISIQAPLEADRVML